MSSWRRSPIVCRLRSNLIYPVLRDYFIFSFQFLWSWQWLVAPSSLAFRLFEFFSDKLSAFICSARFLGLFHHLVFYFKCEIDTEFYLQQFHTLLLPIRYLRVDNSHLRFSPDLIIHLFLVQIRSAQCCCLSSPFNSKLCCREETLHATPSSRIVVLSSYPCNL